MLAVKVSATATTATDAIAPSSVPPTGTAVVPLPRASANRTPLTAVGGRPQRASASAGGQPARARQVTTRRPRLQRRDGAGEHDEEQDSCASQREDEHVERKAGIGLEVAREADRRQRREREGERDREARGHGADRGGSGDVDGEELAPGHPEGPQRRMRSGRECGQPQQRRSEQDEREQRAETGRQPERLRLVVERALDLRGVVALRATIRSSGPREGGDVGGAVSEPDRDDEVGVADVESVDPVERRRQRDRPDRVGLRRRLDPDDPQPDQGADRNDLRERLDDVPAEARPERVRQLVRAKAERHPLERRDEAVPARPTAFRRSPWRRGRRSSAAPGG